MELASYKKLISLTNKILYHYTLVQILNCQLKHEQSFATEEEEIYFDPNIITDVPTKRKNKETEKYEIITSRKTWDTYRNYKEIAPSEAKKNKLTVSPILYSREVAVFLSIMFYECAKIYGEDSKSGAEAKNDLNEHEPTKAGRAKTNKALLEFMLNISENKYFKIILGMEDFATDYDTEIKLCILLEQCNLNKTQKAEIAKIYTDVLKIIGWHGAMIAYENGRRTCFNVPKLQIFLICMGSTAILPDFTSLWEELENIKELFKEDRKRRAENKVKIGDEEKNAPPKKALPKRAIKNDEESKSAQSNLSASQEKVTTGKKKASTRAKSTKSTTKSKSDVVMSSAETSNEALPHSNDVVLNSKNDSELEPTLEKTAPIVQQPKPGVPKKVTKAKIKSAAISPKPSIPKVSEDVNELRPELGRQETDEEMMEPTMSNMNADISRGDTSPTEDEDLQDSEQSEEDVF